ncbi:MAG: hypothetical protein LBE08_08965 [Bifidobacteriaceae bacterium]|nr:hypothetical protein [Bifidobacteriaceae bacterium]
MTLPRHAALSNGPRAGERPYVYYSGGDWVIAGGTSGSEAAIADLGFHYEFDDADICPETITLGISVQSGSAVTFNGSTSVVLTQAAPHVHATWRIDDPDNNSATSTSSVVHFPVSGSGVGSIGTVWPATINVGPRSASPLAPWGGAASHERVSAPALCLIVRATPITT